MGKYLVLGGYTSEAWSRMIDNPVGREGPVRKLADSVGVKLEQFYWSFGDDDFAVIIDSPDDTSAGAFSVAAGSSGSLRSVRTIKLITLEDGRKLLEKAKAGKAAYVPPGAKEPAGVR